MKCVNVLKLKNLWVGSLVNGPNSKNCLDLIFVASPYAKVIFLSDTNYITFAIRKFVLDMPSPGRFQNIGLTIPGLRACETTWFKLGKNQLTQFDSALKLDKNG